MYHRLEFFLFLSCIFVLISIKDTSSSPPEDTFAPRLLWSSDKSHPLTEFGKIHIINRKPAEKGWGWEGDGYGWGWGHHHHHDHDDHHHHHHDHDHHHGHDTVHIKIVEKKAEEKKKGNGLLKGWLKIPEQKFGIHVKGGLGFSFGGDKKGEDDKGWISVKPGKGWTKAWGSWHQHDDGWKGWSDKGWKGWSGWSGWKPKGWGWGWEKPKGWGWGWPKGWGWGLRSGIQGKSDGDGKTKSGEVPDKVADDEVDEEEDDDDHHKEDEYDHKEDEDDNKEDEEESQNERTLLLLNGDEGFEIQEDGELPNERTLLLVNDEIYEDDDRISSQDFSYYNAPELPYYV